MKNSKKLTQSSKELIKTKDIEEEFGLKKMNSFNINLDEKSLEIIDEDEKIYEDPDFNLNFFNRTKFEKSKDTKRKLITTQQEHFVPEGYKSKQLGSITNDLSKSKEKLGEGYLSFDNPQKIGGEAQVINISNDFILNAKSHHKRQLSNSRSSSDIHKSSKKKKSSKFIDLGTVGNSYKLDPEKSKKKFEIIKRLKDSKGKLRKFMIDKSTRRKIHRSLERLGVKSQDSRRIYGYPEMKRSLSSSSKMKFRSIDFKEKVKMINRKIIEKKSELTGSVKPIQSVKNNIPSLDLDKVKIESEKRDRIIETFAYCENLIKSSRSKKSAHRVQGNIKDSENMEETSPFPSTAKFNESSAETHEQKKSYYKNSMKNSTKKRIRRSKFLMGSPNKEIPAQPSKYVWNNCPSKIQIIGNNVYATHKSESSKTPKKYILNVQCKCCADKDDLAPKVLFSDHEVIFERQNSCFTIHERPVVPEDKKDVTNQSSVVEQNRKSVSTSNRKFNSLDGSFIQMNTRSPLSKNRQKMKKSK